MLASAVRNPQVLDPLLGANDIDAISDRTIRRPFPAITTQFQLKHNTYKHEQDLAAFIYTSQIKSFFFKKLGCVNSFFWTATFFLLIA
jgi:hypothetical protein